MLQHYEFKVCDGSFLSILYFIKENRFTRCDSCTHYKQALESTMDKNKRKEIENILQKHIELVMYVKYVVLGNI